MFSNTIRNYSEKVSNEKDDVRVYFNVTEENGGFSFVCFNTLNGEWDDEDAYVMCDGWAAFDGIRHLHFVGEDQDNRGYFHYPEMADIKFCIDNLISLQQQHCRDFV